MARPRAFDEDQLLDAALDAFRREGFARMSLSDLAKAAHMQRGSLYNAYGDKDALFLKVFERYRARFFAETDRALGGADAPLDQRLRRFFAMALGAMRGDAPSVGCLSTRVIMEAADQSQAIKAALQSFLDALQSRLETALRDGQDAGAFRGDPSQAARLAVTLTRGFAVMDRIYDDKAALNDTAAFAVSLLLASPSSAR